jgi:transcriptional regulator
LTFIAGYLTRREVDIWDLRRRRNSQSEIGRLMGVSRQAINKAYRIIDQKVEQAFMEASDANHLEPRIVNLVEGIMDAYSPAHRLPVIVSFSKTNGVKVWYLYEDKCSECHLESSCRRTLENEAEEREVSLTAVDKLRTPTQLASMIFGADVRSS